MGAGHHGRPQYVYRVRHILNNVPGDLGAPDTAVANPLPPDNLTCAGTEPTTITCVWSDNEPDTVALERKSSKNGSWSHIQDVLSGVMTVHD